MQQLRNPRGSLLLAMLFMAVALFTATAHAQTVGEDDEQETAPASRSGQIGDGASASAYYSPAGCYGTSHNPHKSNTPGVGIKGVTEFECVNYKVKSLRTRAQLWRKRWWGYEKIGKVGDNTNAPASHVQASATWGPCENNRYRTEGDHWSDEGSDGIFYAHTMKYADVNTC